MKRRDEWPEQHILIALHLRDHEGMTCREIGERLGRTKNAVIGCLRRVDEETDASDNGHLNGSMCPLWWQNKGVKAA